MLMGAPHVCPALVSFPVVIAYVSVHSSLVIEMQVFFVSSGLKIRAGHPEFRALDCPLFEVGTPPPHNSDMAYGLETGTTTTTCTYCLILTNEFRFQKGTTAAGSADDSAGEDDLDIETEIDTVEIIITKAKYHVQMYQIQKNWARKIISIAHLDITYHCPSLFSRKV